MLGGSMASGRSAVVPLEGPGLKGDGSGAESVTESSGHPNRHLEQLKGLSKYEGHPN